LNSSLSPTHHALTLTISLEEAERIEAQAAPIREAARQLPEEYECNRNGSRSVEVSAEEFPREGGRDQYLRDRH
jgi:hypothetical protein